MQALPPFLKVVDSHTEGEPTRVVIEGWPVFHSETMTGRREELVRDHALLRRASVVEPRGFEAVVGAVLTAPVRPGSACGVIFYNSVGALWMCGHGLIGVVRVLAHLGRIGPGEVHLDTPAGPVSAELDARGGITIRNVPSYLHARDVTVVVPGLGNVTGDVAWGGNWFFLVHQSPVSVQFSHRHKLVEAGSLIRHALADQGITGRDGAVIDHVELFGPPTRSDADSKNFVLCPDDEYDRSPCGTGTSAKMAVLHARGRLGEGKDWRQESITGSLFRGWLTKEGEDLIPHLQGRAFITSEATLLFDPEDPFRGGGV